MFQKKDWKKQKALIKTTGLILLIQHSREIYIAITATQFQIAWPLNFKRLRNKKRPAIRKGGLFFTIILV